MSKGNINYKYLRKRNRNWFWRNRRALFAWTVLLLVVIAGLVFAVMAFGKMGPFKQAQTKPEGQSNEPSSNEPSMPEKDVVWIEDKAPELPSYKRDYTPPENVQFPYFIKVNRAANCVTVYGIDADGAYTIPVIAFACSCGREGEETIIGENYVTTDKYLWRLMVDNSYGHYAFRINGGYLFHSVPYLQANNSTLETDQYNLLGSPASLGCVRMCVRDVKWLYDNCPSGTKVTIYDDAGVPGPLGKPESIKIPLDSEYAGWDPTDPDESNPWHNCKAQISGCKDITAKVGHPVDLLEGITATDTCGNDISGDVATIGRYTFDQEGIYEITYTVTDLIGSTATEKVTLTVTQ